MCCRVSYAARPQAACMPCGRQAGSAGLGDVNCNHLHALLHADPLALVCFVWRAQWWVQCPYVCGGRGGFWSGRSAKACSTLQQHVVHPGQLGCATASSLCASHMQAVPSLHVKRQPHARPGEVCCFCSCVNDSAASCYSAVPVSSALRRLLRPWVAALLVVHCSLCGRVCACVLAATCGRSVLPSFLVSCSRQARVLCANSLQHISLAAACPSIVRGGSAFSTPDFEQCRATVVARGWLKQAVNSSVCAVNTCDWGTPSVSPLGRWFASSLPRRVCP